MREEMPAARAANIRSIKIAHQTARFLPDKIPVAHATSIRLI